MNLNQLIEKFSLKKKKSNITTKKRKKRENKDKQNGGYENGMWKKMKNVG